MKMNYLSTNFLNRVSNKRNNKKLIQAQFEKKSTKFIPIWNKKILCTSDQNPKIISLTHFDSLYLPNDIDAYIFLGIMDKDSFFAINVDSHVYAEKISDEKNGPLSYLNPSTAVALNCAIGDSKISDPRGDVYDLMREADDLIHGLKQLVENTKKFKKENLAKIKQYRDFCLHLSKRALSIEPPLGESRPQHPYRR